MLNNFNIDIEKKALEAGSYIEAIVDFCEEETGKLDFDDIVKMLHPVVLEKVVTEFKKKNFFKSDALKIKNSLENFF